MRSAYKETAKMSSSRFIPDRQPRSTAAMHAKCNQSHTGLAIHDSLLEVYVVSDLHTDYPDNMRWVEGMASDHIRRAQQVHASARLARSLVGTSSAVSPAPAAPACEGEPRESSSAEEAEAASAAAVAEEVLQQVQKVLIVAGDVSDCMNTLRRTLELLQACYWKVFFVPGNHELWVKGPAERHSGAANSVKKLQRVLELCQSLGVQVSARNLGPRFTILPMHAWHHKSFDREPDIPGIPRAGAMTIADYAKCEWPEEVAGLEGQGGLQLAAWADALNNNQQGQLEQGQLEHLFSPAAAAGSSPPPPPPGQAVFGSGRDVISFSHFVPDQRLTPEKRFLSYPNLMKAVGSEPLGERVRRLRPLAHVFGHTHFAWDATLEDDEGSSSSSSVIQAEAADTSSPPDTSNATGAGGTCSTCTAGRGIRYIQAPLCYPLERKLRSRSLSLTSAWQRPDSDEPQEGVAGSSSSSSSGEQEVTAPFPWLPLLLYRAHYKVRVQRQQADDSGGCVSPAAPEEALDPDDAARRGTELLSDEGLQDVGGHHPTTAGPAEGEALRSQQRRAGSGSLLPHEGSPSQPAKDLLMELWRGALGPLGEQGGVSITDWHGELCPPLGGAMWSKYYRHCRRTPENVELAEWVAQRYSKRRRAINKQGS